MGKRASTKVNTAGKPVQEPETSADLVWGVPAIAEELNRTPAQVYHLLSIGALDGAVRKLSHKTIVGSRSALRRLPFLGTRRGVI